MTLEVDTATPAGEPVHLTVIWKSRQLSCSWCGALPAGSCRCSPHRSPVRSSRPMTLAGEWQGRLRASRAVTTRDHR